MNPTRVLTRPRSAAVISTRYGRPFEAWTAKRLPKGTAYRRITSATSPVPSTISYRHPTKGLRFRRANPRLFLNLFHAFTPSAA